MKEKKYVAYTDGSFKPSSNRGGWASIIFDNENNEIIKLHNGMIGTSNNRMEIMAVLETLKWFKQPSDLIIISDSMYVVNTINQGWIKKWFIEKDFSKSNLDLWFKILELLDYHSVTMKWTKGHSNNKLNNQVDELAQFAATCLNLPKDEYITYSKESGKSLVSEYNTRWPNRYNIGSKNGKIVFSFGQES